MLVSLLLKPPGWVKMGKQYTGILSVELGKWVVRKGNLFLYIPFPDLIVGKEHSFILLHCLCVSVVMQEGDGRREKKENEKSREEKCRYRITPNCLQFGLIFRSVRKRTGTCRNYPSKTLLEFPFNLFPLSWWTILIFNQMNGGLGSKQSLPISQELHKWKEPWQRCFFQYLPSVV